MSEYKIKEYLINNNKEFKNLHNLHQECETELENLTKNNTMSSEELQTAKIIKKRKLSLKDSMQKMIQDHSRKNTVQDF